MSGADAVDRIFLEWARECHDLDSTPVAIIGRLGHCTLTLMRAWNAASIRCVCLRRAPCAATGVLGRIWLARERQLRSPPDHQRCAYVSVQAKPARNAIKAPSPATLARNVPHCKHSCEPHPTDAGHDDLRADELECGKPSVSPRMHSWSNTGLSTV